MRRDHYDTDVSTARQHQALDQLRVSVIVLIRDQQTLPNPKSSTRFKAGDLIGLMGDETQLAAVDMLLATTPSS